MSWLSDLTIVGIFAFLGCIIIGALDAWVRHRDYREPGN